MAGKRVSSILFFSLFTIALGNHVKAIRNPNQPATTEKSCHEQLVEHLKTILILESDVKRNNNEVKNLQHLLKQKNEELKNSQKDVCVLCMIERTPERFSRCMPYGYGIVMTGVIDYLFSCFAKTKRLKKSKYFIWLDQSIKDSKRLQIFSLAAASKSGKFHEVINGNSAAIYSLSDGLPIGATNITEEIANAVGLRWCWHQLTARHFITCHLEKIGNNKIVKFVYRLPEPIKKICQNFGRLCAIRILWNLEKSLVDQLV